jgi:hypothetical protein
VFRVQILLFFLFTLLAFAAFTFAGQMFVSLFRDSETAQGIGGLLVSMTAMFSGILIKPGKKNNIKNDLKKKRSSDFLRFYFQVTFQISGFSCIGSLRDITSSKAYLYLSMTETIRRLKHRLGLHSTNLFLLAQPIHPHVTELQSNVRSLSLHSWSYPVLLMLLSLIFSLLLNLQG